LTQAKRNKFTSGFAKSGRSTGAWRQWMLVLPIVIAVWYIVEQVIALFVRSSLLPIFWGLALPVIVSVAAWIFRRFRERHGV
jgi:hypothetical protein